DVAARDSGSVAECVHVLFRSLDQSPVAEVFDERTVRISFADVGEEKHSPGDEQTVGDLQEQRRLARIEVVEEAAGEEEIERVARQRPRDGKHVTGAEVDAVANRAQRVSGK